MTRIASLACALVFALLATPSPAGDGPRLKPPRINPAGGCYPLGAEVRIAIRAEPGDIVIYTLDGTLPAWNRGIRSDSHLVFLNLPPGDVVVRAAAFRRGPGLGPVTEVVFTRDCP